MSEDSSRVDLERELVPRTYKSFQETVSGQKVVVEWIFIQKATGLARYSISQEHIKFINYGFHQLEGNAWE